MINPWLLSILGSLPSNFLIAFAVIIFCWLICDIALSLWLILGVRVTVGTMQPDATEEITQNIQEVLMNKGKLNRRLAKAFPNQTPSKKKPRKKKKS